MTDWINEVELEDLIKPGDIIYVGGSTNEPTDLLDQLENVSDLH